jgi:hypothetical protein
MSTVLEEEAELPFLQPATAKSAAAAQIMGVWNRMMISILG